MPTLGVLAPFALAPGLSAVGCGLAVRLRLLLVTRTSKPGGPGCGLVHAMCLPARSGGTGATR